MRSKLLPLALAAAGIGFAGQASAALTEFQTFVGNVGYSSDGFGSSSAAGVISASVPAGSTVLAAYLYTATYNSAVGDGAGSLLNGTSVAYGAPVFNADACCSLASRRADVTSIIKPLIDGGAGGIYNFNVTEATYNQDGEALVVVYSNPALAVGTFAILDGFALTAGDTTSINFGTPLDPTAPGFFAEMFLGIGFSYDGTGCTDNGQTSRVTVNGTLMTANAGCNDDSVDATPADGNLFTTGGFNDPISPSLPTTAQDHERYSLVPYVTAGSTTITVATANASQNDNIFLAGFYVTGRAGVNEPPPPEEPPTEPPTPPTTVPEPTTLSLLGLGALALGLRRRKIAA